MEPALHANRFLVRRLSLQEGGLVMFKTIPLALAAALFMGQAASATVGATATTDLNMRSGPGTGYPVVGVIAAHAPVSITSCAAGSMWCMVEASGMQGWAYSAYLTPPVGGQVTYGSTAPLVLQSPTPANSADAAAQGHSYDVFPNQSSPNYGNPFGGKS
jgi:uncharacterized protein YraI